jgi:hypothetical protein
MSPSIGGELLRLKKHLYVLCKETLLINIFIKMLIYIGYSIVSPYRRKQKKEKQSLI